MKFSIQNEKGRVSRVGDKIDSDPGDQNNHGGFRHDHRRLADLDVPDYSYAPRPGSRGPGTARNLPLYSAPNSRIVMQGLRLCPVIALFGLHRPD